MSSKMQQRIQHARDRGVLISYVQFPKSMPAKSGWWIVDDTLFVRTGDATICMNTDTVHGPYSSKRAAKNDAYRIAIGKKPLHIGVKS